MWLANICMTNMTAVKNGMVVLVKLLQSSFQENSGSPASGITASQSLFYFWAPGYFRPCSYFSTFHRIVAQFWLEGTSRGHLVQPPVQSKFFRVGCSDSSAVTFQTHPSLEIPMPVWAICSSSSWNKQLSRYLTEISHHPSCVHCLWS